MLLACIILRQFNLIPKENLAHEIKYVALAGDKLSNKHELDYRENVGVKSSQSPSKQSSFNSGILLSYEQSKKVTKYICCCG